MRKKIAAGNWKMNLTADAATQLVTEMTALADQSYQGNGEVIFAPPFPFLAQVADLVKGRDAFHVAAQNMHQMEKGAYTGEVAASMLVSIGVTHCILGHSERRQYFGETNELLAQKVNTALSHGLKVIFCIGESLEQRESGSTLDVIRSQVHEGTFHLEEASFRQLIIAYEPIWAIGTGVTATPEQAQEVHAFIRGLIREKYGDSCADDTTILYGGSVKPANADELFQQPDIDGGLVGGASLKAPDFAAILAAL